LIGPNFSEKKDLFILKITIFSSIGCGIYDQDLFKNQTNV